jgi:hypothetical protein
VLAHTVSSKLVHHTGKSSRCSSSACIRLPATFALPPDLLSDPALYTLLLRCNFRLSDPTFPNILQHLARGYSNLTD